jgi:predicted transcriptional regulator of viral defense system
VAIVSTRTSAGLPAALAQRDVAVLRPRDAADVYVNPRWNFKRLVANGVLAPLAPGYFAMVPRRWVGRPWRPDLNAVALGIAQADYGRDAVALCYVSAARHHGAVPRAVAVAVVAVPAQRALLHVGSGTVRFVTRDVARLEVEAIETELAHGWVTTVEQTLVDLASRPYGLDEAQAAEAIRALAGRADWAVAERLARAQRKVRALARAAEIVERS